MAEPGVRVEFEMYPVVNGLKSKEGGREITDDKPHVRIRNAGEDKHEFFGPVNEQIKARFPDEWAAFQRGEAEIHSGTPVSRWPQLTPGQVKMLKGLNIYTVEDMATLSDAGVAKVGMGGNKLRQDAQRFLSLAQSSADVEQLEELRAANKAQAEMLATLQAQMAELIASKPGKKTKEAA